MLFYQANLTCKNQDCLQPIWLPLSIPLDKFEHQLKWPKDDWKRNFLCLSCKQVNLYKAQDVRGWRIRAAFGHVCGHKIRSIGNREVSFRK